MTDVYLRHGVRPDGERLLFCSSEVIVQAERWGPLSTDVGWFRLAGLVGESTDGRLFRSLG